MQYIRNTKTFFNTPLNKNRKDIESNNQKAILGSIHFKLPSHNFKKKHAEFTLLKKANNTTDTDIDTKKLRLRRREELSILNLNILTRKRLNQELKKVQVLICCIIYVHLRPSSTNHHNYERNFLKENIKHNFSHSS